MDIIPRKTCCLPEELQISHIQFILSHKSEMVTPADGLVFLATQTPPSFTRI